MVNFQLFNAHTIGCRLKNHNIPITYNAVTEADRVDLEKAIQSDDENRERTLAEEEKSKEPISTVNGIGAGAVMPPMYRRKSSSTMEYPTIGGWIKPSSVVLVDNYVTRILIGQRIKPHRTKKYCLYIRPNYDGYTLYLPKSFRTEWDISENVELETARVNKIILGDPSDDPASEEAELEAEPTPRYWLLKSDKGSTWYEVPPKVWRNLRKRAIDCNGDHFDDQYHFYDVRNCGLAGRVTFNGEPPPY